jgi:outer membrane protein TolC
VTTAVGWGVLALGGWAGSAKAQPPELPPASAPAYADAQPADSTTLPPPRRYAPAGLPPGGLPPSVYAKYLPEYADAKVLPIDLPNALRLVNASNPTIAIARERIAQAYAVLGQARVLWIPNLWVGGNPSTPTFAPTFYHHDGLIQSSHGQVFFVDRNAIFIQAGAGLQLSVADALFSLAVGRAGVAAVQARARAVTNDLQLDVALAYLDLLRAYGELSINDEAVRRARELLTAAENTLAAGIGPKTQADVEQARAEYRLRAEERPVLQGRAAAASARLAQFLLLDPSVDLLPGDQTVVPIALVPADGPLDDLVAVSLMQRPELAENRALIAQALARWRQARYGPLIPSLQAFYYGGSFISGNPTLSTAGGREDFLAQVTWELKNAGLGNVYQARERRAEFNVSQLQLVETQARVAAEVTAAAKIVRARERTLNDAQVAVSSAEELWRKLRELAFGVGGRAREFDPLQPLLAVRALREARLAYLDQVIEYNRNQFRLYWAMGQPPACALPGARALAPEVPVLPGPPGTNTPGPR